MKRFRIAVVAILVFANLIGSVPILAQSGLYTVYVNGVKVGGYPMIKDGVAYLPATTLAQAMSLSIRWDSRLNIVKVNDQVLNVRPLNEEGRLFLPVEAVAHAVGGAVEWDGRTSTIRVTASPNGSPAAAVRTAPPVTPTPPVRSTPPVGNVTYTPSVPSTIPVVTVNPVPPVSVTPTVPRTTTVSSPPGTVSGGGFPQGTSPSGGFPTANSGVPFPSPAAYPSPNMTTTPLRAPSAPPRMPPGLELPPVQTQPGNTPLSVQSPPIGSVYVPKSAQNNVFAVTVTNIEGVSSIKDFYHPKPGYRFVIVYLSQQNVSNEVQIYTGRFSLLDQNNRTYDYVEGLSNFWLVILRPYGINFGYLVFEVPVDSHPTRLALHALNQSPLTLNL